MELSVRTRSVEITDELRDLISRRMQLAFDTFAHRVVSASVYLADVNGPRGGMNDKVCHIAVVIRGLGEVVLRASAATVPAAVARAAHRLKYRVSEGLRNVRRQDGDSIRTGSPAAYRQLGDQA